MKFIRLVLLGALTQTVALTPGKLPNGRLRRFVANEQFPCSDLKSVEEKQALLISKHWMNNIIVHPVIQPEDEHVLKRIQRLHQFAEKNRDSRYVYLLWVPEGVMYEVLFMVLLHVGTNPDTLTVSFIIPSPYWDSSQIESHELKRALEDLAEKSKKELNLEPLYQKDPRYRLAWKDWT